ncbi:PGBM protein, partial [Polypterus senegalus]
MHLFTSPFPFMVQASLTCTSMILRPEIPALRRSVHCRSVFCGAIAFHSSSTMQSRRSVYYRALVNFTNSIDFVPALEDITSTEFQEVSEAVVDTLESEYRKIPGDQTVSLVLIKDIHGSVFVELDVGSDFNSNDQQIERVLYSVIRSGSIASYDTSVTGFQFRRLGEVITSPRTCTAEEFTCQDGECIEIGFRCDDRIDCRDMSDEIGCEEITTARPVVTTRPRPSPTTKQVLVTRPPPRTVAPAGRPCRLDEAVCQNGQCIPRDYLCDGERDCNDGSDELSCGTQSPCEPNEFKCQNGRCALKLWRCDGDNDCGDNSDETSCPTKGPGEECAPEQFVCVSSRQCIPASYQCDEETDCPDRSDEVGCTPPDVIRPPEETIMANKGETVQFTCIAVGVPTPIITWRLNWGHIPLSGRITMTSKEGRGTLIIRDVKDADQGAYTCEAINAKGMVFGIPDGVLIIKQQTGPCPSGYFNVKDNSRCIPCFCFGITQNCQSTQRLRKKLTLRFTEPYDFKGVNVSFPSKPASPPLTSSQILINPDYEEFQLVDLSRRFLNLESFWTLPAPFLGNKVDSYGGFLSYKVRYTLARGQTEPEERPDVTIIGNGQKLIYRRKVNVPPNQTSQQRIQFIEDNWQHESGDAVTRETLMMTLVNLDAINIRTVYDNKMVSVGLSDITMDTTTLEHTNQGSADTVEQCRCPPGYTGLSCESCAPGFERIKEGPYLGTCAGCHCNGHASTCDPVSGYCLQNAVGVLCDECKTGFFHLSKDDPDGCTPCFCMGITRQCTSSLWSRDQVRASNDDQQRMLFTLSNSANTRTINTGILRQGSTELTFRTFSELPSDIYYWVLPDRFKGDKVTSYGGELSYTIRYTPRPGSSLVYNRPDVVLQGNDIFLEHFSETQPIPGSPTTITLVFRESAWRRADGQPCTREHLLMALANIGVFMIRATYAERMIESSISNIRMDIAVPYSTGKEKASEVEECACPTGYSGPSCQQEATSETCAYVCCKWLGLLGCAAGYSGNPLLGQPCRDNINGGCVCDPKGSLSDRCDVSGQCLCKMHVEGRSCSSCKTGYFHLSPDQRDGCLSCFCMGVTQQCTSSSYYRDQIATSFAPGNFQNFALLNRQRSNRISTGFTVEVGASGDTQLSYSQFNQLGQELHYWQLPEDYQGDKSPAEIEEMKRLDDEIWELISSFSSNSLPPTPAPELAPPQLSSKTQSSPSATRSSSSFHSPPSSLSSTARAQQRPSPLAAPPGYSSNLHDFKVGSYGGRLRYTLSYNAGARGSPLRDADVQISGNDIMLVAYHDEHLRPKEQRSFEIVFREQFWKRPDGQQATREHLLMVLADLDDILIRASYSTDMISASISKVSMDVAVPNYTGLQQALEVEQCRCPPGYQGLSCQDTLGRLEDSTLDTVKYASAVVIQILAIQRLGPVRIACTILLVSSVISVPPASMVTQLLEHQKIASLVPALQLTLRTDSYAFLVQVEPRKAVISQGGEATLHCQASGSPPHYYYWSRGDGRQIPSSAQIRHQGQELHFSRLQPSDAGVYLCTCRGLHYANTSRAELIVTAEPSKAIQVTVEEPTMQRVSVGSTVNFICTAKSKSPAYTLVWTRQNNGKLPDRAMDFNGILTIHNVQPEDQGRYICTGSNMFDMDEGTAVLGIQAVVGVQPVATVDPPVLTIQQGQRAEFHCSVTGNPQPSIEWLGGQGNRISPHAIIQGGSLVIPAVERADEAEYLCKALNAHGEHVARAVLYVHSASLPHIQVSPQRMSANEGETVRLYCRAGGTPSPALSWKKLGGHLPSQARMERTDIGTLVIPSIKSSDAGIYLCVGTNAIGSSEARIEVSVIVENPNYGEVLEMCICLMENPTFNLSWKIPTLYPLSQYRQINEKSISANLYINDEKLVSGPRLRILQASAADIGTYTCRATSALGTEEASVSLSVTSQQSRQQSPIISIEPHSAVVRQGEIASFRCRVFSGTQPIKIEWKMGNNQPLQDNVKIGPDGSVLTIASARYSNQGGYRCVASNLFGITHSIASLTVKGPPTVSVTPKGTIRVKVGEPINLECNGAGDPRPTVTWRRLNDAQKLIIQSPVPMDSNAVMQILAARHEDSGTYVCVARNQVGTVQAQVEVIVEGGPIVPTIPIASVDEPMLIVVEGGTATLRCSASGYPTPTITWSKLRAPLPWKHNIVNNTLMLPNVGRQDSGQYICNATNVMGTSEITIMLDVETLPYATTLEDSLSVQVGEVIRLQCLAHGSAPLKYQWFKVNGTLPSRARVQESTLQINLAATTDSGTYKCVVSNKVGTSESFASVTVMSHLEVRVSPHIEVKGPGSSVEFICSATGDRQTKIEWIKEGGHLPPNHRIVNGILRIENLEKANEGVYICKASSRAGQAEDRAKLTVQALPKVMINVRTQVQMVMVGNAVEFECEAIGDPKPVISWSKVDGDLPSHIMVKEGMLRIDQVKESDAGHYRCTATNEVGSVQSEVVLNVQTLPVIAAQPEVKEVTEGSTAVFPCLASGYPIPDIKWTKLEGELPSNASVEGNVLTIPFVTSVHTGTYVCTASNNQGKVQAFSMLKVRERVVPYFTQTPLSYLTLPTIKNAYKTFHIKITFRPDTPDDQTLSLFVHRFDVGSGMATIRYPSPIKLGEFHTVVLYRNQTQGSIVVDGQNPVKGSSQGKFQGLDLNEQLYVGGYPDYKAISKTTGLTSGFVGCIRQLIIQDDEVIFKDLDRSSTGISNCPTCRDQPCQNGGLCRDSEASSYVCDCPRRFTGSNCEHYSALHCHPEACGPDATCINRPSGDGYDCRCHLGKSGDKCTEGTLVTTPSFNGETSFITYPPLTNIHYDLRIDLEFKPIFPDGLLFFSGGKKAKVEDFVSIAIIDRYVEFRYELGTGMAVLRSAGPLVLGRWHRITAERNNQHGTLKINDEKVISKSSPGKAQGLNIHTPMYLGGVPNLNIIPKPANISELFEGCIGEVSINGKKVDISYSFTRSEDISQCTDDSPCDRMPCLNKGTCFLTGEYEYQCICKEGYEGDRCEIIVDMCLAENPCMNGAVCTKKQCVCPMGFTGQFCEKVNPVLFIHSSPEAPETIELEIHTTSPDGVLLWQGVELGENGKGQDFISLGLENGHVVFSYQLGSGEAKIISEDPINDGDWHKVTAVRYGNTSLTLGSNLNSGNGDELCCLCSFRAGRHGYIQVDGDDVVTGESGGAKVMVNTKGSIYLGGTPDIEILTGGKFQSGITGCIKNLVLMNAQPGEAPHQPIDLQVHAEDGVNVKECPS